MKQFLISLYSLTPHWLRVRIGQTVWLGFFRDFLLKQNGAYREVNTHITKFYETYQVNFEFYASIKDVSKASMSGIENTLLKNSFKLLSANNKHNNDFTIFDIGANFGYLSLVWGSSLCKNNGNVYAFEPNANVYNSFKKSINKSKLENIVKVERKAIGFENKIVDLYLDNTTSNIIKISESNKFVPVEMITLDSYCKVKHINKCDLIKIDVDGVELDILKGSINSLKKFRPIFIIETNEDMRIVDFFNQNNYKVLDMDLKPYIPNTALPLNIFCTPN